MQGYHDYCNNMSSRAGPNSPTPGGDARAIARSRQHSRRSVVFTPALQVHRYPPTVWEDDEEVNDDDEWDVGSYEDEDPSLAEETVLAEKGCRGGGGSDSDDGMSWEEALPDQPHLPGTAEEQHHWRNELPLAAFLHDLLALLFRHLLFRLLLLLQLLLFLL